MRLVSLAALAVAILAFWSPASAAHSGIVLETPKFVLVRHGNNEACLIPAAGYSAFEVGENSAKLNLTGVELGKGSKRVLGKGITRVSWEPAGSGTEVTFEFAQQPISTLVNAVSGSEIRPDLPQVVAGFYFEEEPQNSRPYPVLGSHHPGETGPREDPYGHYKLPKFKPAKYSDALVTLNVRNVDFRDVLWLMSEIGNVSIILDPYWADEPTGSRRPPGAGADPGGGSGGGDGGSGFRGGGDFIPAAPREGTGNLSLRFNDVPFDTALDLIIMSVGLVKVDIYPGDLS